MSDAPSDAPLKSPTPITIEPVTGGYDRPGVRKLLAESKLPTVIHKVVRAPFGHTVLTLQTLDAVVEAFDVAVQAGQAIQGALMEDIAQTGSLAIPEPTRDQRLFIGAFTTTVLLDKLRAEERAAAARQASDVPAASDGSEGSGKIADGTSGGLGLAIVRDIASEYAGSLTLDRSTMGGLRATVMLPGR